MSAFATVLPVSDDRLEESLVEAVGKNLVFRFSIKQFGASKIAQKKFLTFNEFFLKYQHCIPLSEVHLDPCFDLKIITYLIHLKIAVHNA